MELPPAVKRNIGKLQEGQSPKIKDIAWRAQGRHQVFDFVDRCRKVFVGYVDF